MSRLFVFMRGCYLDRGLRGLAEIAGELDHKVFTFLPPAVYRFRYLRQSKL